MFLKPIEGNAIIDFMSVKNSIGEKTYFYKGEEEPELEHDIAIIGVIESRGGNLESSRDAANFFRNYFYALYPSWSNLSIIDFGNIQTGNDLNDTYFALSEVVFKLVSKGVLPIIIGGTNDLNLPVYKAFAKLEQMVNLLTIDRKIDMEESGASNDRYIRDIILGKPNFLFNYANLCSQAYYLNPEIEGLLDKLYFDNVRLGKIQENINVAEPYIRNADVISFDLNAIRQAEVPGATFASPNGLFGNEACQLSRYAGMSDKLSAIGFYEATPEFDINGQTFSLLSQMVWYFIEGFANRKKESPLSSDINYTQYRVMLTEANEELVFIKSNKSDRWWMKVPYPPSEKMKFERHHLVPCNYSDYQVAMRDEMPDLWIKTYHKINVN